MEKRTRVRIVAVLYLILGVFYIVLGWNAKSWYPNMFASNTYYGEWGGTILARVAAIVVGTLQVMISSCLLLKKYNGATLVGVVLVLACLFFSIGAISSGDDPSILKVSGGDFWWFGGYFVLLGADLLFVIFIEFVGKSKANGLTMINADSDKCLHAPVLKFRSIVSGQVDMNLGDSFGFVLEQARATLFR